MKRHLMPCFSILVGGTVLIACDEVEHPETPFPAGGDLTVYDRSSNGFGGPAPNLDAVALGRHVAGDAAFEAVFVTAPAPVQGGLGPRFNHTSCEGCHPRDGRGLALVGGPPLNSPLLVRVSLAAGEPEAPGGAVPVPGLGTQVQDHGVFGVAPEATVALAWEEVAGAYGDGTPYALRRPSVTLTWPDGTPVGPEVLRSVRIPPPVFGLGLLEAIDGAAIEALADPDDADGAGISGRVNRVWDGRAGRVAIGRFGWKANTVDLERQVAGAYFNDMGITSSLHPEPDGSREVDDETVALTTFYVATLGVPAPRARDAEARRGEATFSAMGCDGCHVATTFVTGEHPIAELARQTIRPHTDLLLHDMGPGLADARPDWEASGSEWRTAPLWGIGLTETVLPLATYLHDGRARTMAEAILWHGGEAEAAKEAFRSAPAREREAVLAFLRSL